MFVFDFDSFFTALNNSNLCNAIPRFPFCALYW